MSIPAKLSYDALLASQKVWFSTPTAFNQWVSAITVPITSDNIPGATTTHIGGVLQATLVDSYIDVVSATSYVDLQDQAGNSVKAASQVDFDTLKLKVDALSLSYVNLLSALRNAGLIA